MGNKQKEIANVVSLLSQWIVSIKLFNTLGLYDINKYAESISTKILNNIYNLDLSNLNKESANFPSIDLGDKTNKIAFQVTSRRYAAKIRDNLQKFVDNKYDKIYSNGIYFFILSEDNNKISFGHKNPNKILPSFDKSKHILTIKNVMEEIDIMYDNNYSKFTEIVDVLKEELGKIEKLQAKKSKEKSSAPAITFSFKDYFHITDADDYIEVFLQIISRRYEKNITPLFELKILEEEIFINKLQELQKDSSNLKMLKEATEIEEILDYLTKVKSEIIFKIKQLINIKIEVGYRNSGFALFVSSLKDIIIDLWETQIILEDTFLMNYVETDVPSVKPLYRKGETRLYISSQKDSFNFSIHEDSKDVEKLFKKYYSGFKLNSLNARASSIFAIEVFDLGYNKIVAKIIPSFIGKLYHHPEKLTIKNIALTSLPIVIA
jgi:hypothetical protein